MIETLRSSILAGIFIGIASLMYIKVGGIVGACLFSFGLVAVVCYWARLYTGMAGFVDNWKEVLELPIIILGNVVGCFIVSLIAIFSIPDITELAQSVVSVRLEKEWWQAGLLGIGCGILMTTAVGKLKPWIPLESRNWLPLLFAVPLFILCGFLHSIADAAYYLMCGFDYLGKNWSQVLIIWSSVIIGNFLGCNVPRLLE